MTYVQEQQTFPLTAPLDLHPENTRREAETNVNKFELESLWKAHKLTCEEKRALEDTIERLQGNIKDHVEEFQREKRERENAQAENERLREIMRKDREDFQREKTSLNNKLYNERRKNAALEQKNAFTECQLTSLDQKLAEARQRDLIKEAEVEKCDREEDRNVASPRQDVECGGSSNALGRPFLQEPLHRHPFATDGDHAGSPCCSQGVQHDAQQHVVPQRCASGIQHCAAHRVSSQGCPHGNRNGPQHQWGFPERGGDQNQALYPGQGQGQGQEERGAAIVRELAEQADRFARENVNNSFSTLGFLLDAVKNETRRIQQDVSQQMGRTSAVTAEYQYLAEQKAREAAQEQKKLRKIEAFYDLLMIEKCALEKQNHQLKSKLRILENMEEEGKIIMGSRERRSGRFVVKSSQLECSRCHQTFASMEEMDGSVCSYHSANPVPFVEDPDSKYWPCCGSKGSRVPIGCKFGKHVIKPKRVRAEE